MTTQAAAHPPLSGSAAVVGTLGVSLATFMTVLDSSIANVSLPAIAGDLGVSPAQSTWVVTSFGVANAIAVPLTGWLARRFGQVRLMVGSVLAFTAFSWLCGAAPSLEILILARVLQGLAAGPLIPISQVLLLASYTPARAGTAMAAWGVTVLVAPLVGPLLGGWITDNISWPWIFYINIPFGLLSAAMTWSIYRDRESPHGRAPLDRVGLALLVIWVGALQLMVDLGKDHDWFESRLIVWLGVVAAVTLVFFLAWELTEREPVVDLRLFSQRNFTLGTIAFSGSYGLFFGNVVLLPLWLQQHMAYTASWAGAVLAPVGVFAILLSPWVGRNLSRFEPRLLTSISFVGYGVVLWLRGQVTVETDLWTILLPTLLQGAATAFYFIPLQSIIYSGLPPARLPAAGGLSTFVRFVAGAVGTSVFATLWERRAVLHHARLTELVDTQGPNALPALQALQTSGYGDAQSLALINRLIDQQAYTMAVTDVFQLSAWLYLLLLLPLWSTTPMLAPAAAARR
jgi:DHA2 family multidrug resistance protein